MFSSKRTDIHSFDWMEKSGSKNISYKYIKNDNLIIKQSTKRATAFPRRQLPDLF